MNPVLRNTLAVIFGLLVGGITNMGIIMLSGSIIPLPEGIDPSNTESLKAGMHLFGVEHFIFPFLAHAIGTFVGAYITAILAISHKMKFALGIGAFFFIGGITAASMLPSPIWFIVLDLVVAYIPMGLLAGSMARS